MVVHHHCVVHAIHFLPPIKPTPMGWIVPWLTNFDESTINKSNANLELWKLHSQDLMLLNSGPLDLINNDEIDARCNKNVIIIYCTLAPIPWECIIFGDIIMFHIQNEVEQALLLTIA
jgi:hypothetical protein